MGDPVTERPQAISEPASAGGTEPPGGDRLYRALAKHFPNGSVILFDLNLRHLVVGGSGLAAVGLSAEGLEGRTIWESLPPATSALLEPRYRDALAGIPSAFDMTFANRRYLLRVVPVRDDDGSVFGGMVVTQDVTEVRGAEEELALSVSELKQANEELRVAEELTTHFVAITSHELQNPVAIVLGSAWTLRKRWDTLDDGRKRLLVEMIDRQARRVSRLVHDLMTLTRLQAGVLQTHPQEIDAARAIRDVVADFGEDASIHVDCPPRLPVVADPDHLQQILINYVANAMKYGQPPLTVEARADGDLVEIRVRDCGPGVPEEFLGHLFDRFMRADTRATRTVEGTGLGLSIVRSLAEAQGGEAWYEPNLPQGSCFGVRLPVPQATRSSSRPKRSGPQADP